MVTLRADRQNINLRSIDMGVLAVFDAVMKDRSMTRAARRLHMSQPAVSSAIKKLRSLLNDPLFLRIPGGIRPTPRALELSLPVQELLAHVQRILEPTTFSPMTESRIFRIAISEHCAELILPPLATKLLHLAPGIRLRVFPKKGEGVPVQLASGDIDMAIGTFMKCPPHLSQARLFSDSYVCVMRENHPLAGRVDIPGYVNAKHLAVSPIGVEKQPVDAALARLGFERNVAMTLNHLSPAPDILERTDLILTTYRTLAEHAPLFRDLHVSNAPFELEPLSIRLLWHAAGDNHLALGWLRDIIAEVVLDLQKEEQDQPCKNIVPTALPSPSRYFEKRPGARKSRQRPVTTVMAAQGQGQR